MAGYQEVYDTDLMVACRSILFDRCTFIGKTVLVGAHPQGSTALQVTETGSIMPGDVLDFPASDGHPAHQVIVDHRYNGTDNPVPLAADMVSGAQSATDQDWPDGTDVVRGLFLGVPPTTEGLLNGENSMLYIEAFQDETSVREQRMEGTVYSMRVQYARREVVPLGQPGTIGTSMISWSLEQQWISRLHMREVRNALARNPKLMTPDGKQWAIRLGDALNPDGNWFRTSYGEYPISMDLRDFGATGEFAVIPVYLPVQSP